MGAFDRPEFAHEMNSLGRHRNVALVCMLLAIVTLAVFWPVRRAEFINCDDQVYVIENEPVTGGLTGAGAAWAFRSVEAGNWHPLTWLSHMTDVQLYGLKAGGHHATNLALHTASVVLLFLVLRAMTQAFWRSAFVAGAFAIHPLHVESVAWVAERKDVLCGLFWVLTMAVYAGYARQRTAARHGLVVSLLALALMSKPMAVSLPVMLLLLDWWPLHRFDFARRDWLKSFRSCLVEKLPLFALAAASSVVTIYAQRAAGAVVEITRLPLAARIANAIYSYVWYLQKTFWPSGLSAFYPLHGDYEADTLAVAIVVLAGISFAAIWLWRRAPYVAFGWLWYLITLLPVIGLVQVGAQARADRYTYLPLIGVFVVVAWGAADLACNSIVKRTVVKGLGAGAVLALAIACAKEVRYWRDSEALFGHALEVTPNNAFAHQSYGSSLVEKGKLEEAVEHFEAALRIDPSYPRARNNLAAYLLRKGRPEEAIEQCQMILASSPQFHIARFNLARALESSGKQAEAAAQFEEFLRSNPKDTEARLHLGLCFGALGKYADAIAQFEEICRHSPTNALALLNLGSVLEATGRDTDALARYEAGVRAAPEDAELHRRLGLLLAKLSRPGEAVLRFREVVRLRPTAEAHYDLALALVISNQHAEAIKEYREAVRLRPDFSRALNDLAWILATHPDAALRDGAEAVRCAERACKLTEDKQASCLGTLDAAFAESGRFADAVTTARLTRDTARENGQTEIAKAAEERLKLYESNQSYRQQLAPGSTSGPRSP